MSYPEHGLVGHGHCYQFLVYVHGHPRTFLVSPFEDFYAVEELQYVDRDGNRTTRYLGRIGSPSLNLLPLHEDDRSILSKVASEIENGWICILSSWHKDAQTVEYAKWSYRPWVRAAKITLPKTSPCRFCSCESCTGVDPITHDQFSLLLENGDRICDSCWLYPPCGLSDDCDEYLLTGRCSHRPEVAPYPSPLQWESYTSLGFSP